MRGQIRGVFHVTGGRLFFVTGTKGGCNKKSAGGVTSPLSLNSFVFCGLSLLIGFPRADTEKSGETIATPPPPPETGVPTGPDSGTVSHAPIRPHAGSLSSLSIPAGRPGIAPRRAAGRRETDLCGNKYIMRLVRLIIGVFKPTWMPQAPKGETVRETVTLAVCAHTWNARWRSVVCLLMFVALLFAIWQAAERFGPRSPARQSLLQATALSPRPA